MSSFPTARQLATTAATLGEIEPETRAQSQALSDARQLLDALAQSPDVAKTLEEQLAGACAAMSQSQRERGNTVIADRLRTLNTQAMDQFDQGHSNPTLRAAYLAFARATLKAFSTPGVNALEDPDTRERQSRERHEAFEVAETTVSAVRKALKQSMGRMPPSAPLRQVAADYIDMGRSTAAFIEHLALAIEVVEAMNQPTATPAAPKRAPGR